MDSHHPMFEELLYKVRTQRAHRDSVVRTSRSRYLSLTFSLYTGHCFVTSRRNSLLQIGEPSPHPRDTDKPMCICFYRKCLIVVTHHCQTTPQMQVQNFQGSPPPKFRVSGIKRLAVPHLGQHVNHSHPSFKERTSIDHRLWGPEVMILACGILLGFVASVEFVRLLVSLLG